MAIFKTEDTKGKKEDLASFISMITRDETPFLSSIGSKKATSVYHEWQTDSLAAPVANAKAEGLDFSAADTPTSTTRLGNYSQILIKEIKISKTLDSVSKAGRNSEFAYQMKKKGTELKRDLEHALVGTRQITDGTGTADTVADNTGRKMGGYQSWVPKENNWDASAGTPAFQAAAGGDGKTAHTAGTAGTHTLALTDVDEVMQRVYEEGGKATVMMMSPSNKRSFSTLAQGAGSNTRRNLDEKGSLRQSVELYESDFGVVKVVPNYIQGLASGLDISDGVGGATDVLVYDPSWWSMANLRALQTADVGQKGDSTVGMIVEETTLECRNPHGSAMISGLGVLVA
tara:strand:+ start:3092 stop:4123 length:1032 start_codon:yes stop_codon:yes gene_type:complete